MSGGKWISLVLLLTITLFGLSGCGSSEAKSEWNDGTYSGLAEGVHGNIELDVIIENGKIKTINVHSQAETSGVSEVAFAEVPKSIIENQTVEVETVAGATVTSKAIIDAVKDALEKSK